MKSRFCAEALGATESKTIKVTYISLPLATNEKPTQHKRKQMAKQVPWKRWSRSHLVGGEERITPPVDFIVLVLTYAECYLLCLTPNVITVSFI